MKIDLALHGELHMSLQTHFLKIKQVKLFKAGCALLHVCLPFLAHPGLPRSGKNIWKFCPDQGKVREFCGWSEKFRKDLESQEKVREFENK